MSQVAAAEGGLLFDAEFLRKLERLEIVARKIFRGQLRGEHTTPRRGRGLEFADFRLYHPGDDLRYVDWNLSSRLDRLFVKLFASEEDLTLHLLLDASASMGFGAPAKFDYGRRLVAALAYIGLHNLDRVGVATFAAGLGASFPPLKARNRMAGLLSFLLAQRAAGATDLAAAMRALTARTRGPGLSVVVSDLLGVSGVESGLDALRYRGHDVVVVQLLAEEEIEPPLDGALTLVDAEDGARLRVTVDAELRALYRERLDRRLDAIEAYCRRAGLEYLRASTAIPFEDLVLRYLRDGLYFR